MVRSHQLPSRDQPGYRGGLPDGHAKRLLLDHHAGTPVRRPARHREDHHRGGCGDAGPRGNEFCLT
jgi:hypothetical protein